MATVMSPSLIFHLSNKVPPTFVSSTNHSNEVPPTLLNQKVSAGARVGAGASAAHLKGRYTSDIAELTILASYSKGTELYTETSCRSLCDLTAKLEILHALRDC